MVMKSFRGHSPRLGNRVWVDDSAVIMGNVEIGDDSSVWPLVSIRGDMHQIRIGARTSIQDNSCLHITHASEFNPEGHPLIIGDDVTVGHLVMLHGCTIGNQVLVGMSSTILDGAIIEDQVVIGAGSLVPPGKKLESGYLYFGSPVKQIRPLTVDELNYFQYACQNYVKLKNEYLNNND
ncbi:MULTISPECIES: gamma carbonic anhydrase family protein [unclassified Methylophaga]|uniref:gamma carbonic anhydrase family protein n=2 Tax=Methylophaga TaxID=40222 RepID=UPI000C98918C|nr:MULTISPECIES: gamma carbonic anhydrase family protein [unclassified Methylophaga]MAK67805.1 gamma carbonic anhydrase family protein [Methylophaga sp.]MAY18486.1 gamma carbonic anhydrase family protein [Methylophaga sp.]MBN45885.1 gamma carbonic anhydrase family protein [Methylophaga sp.]HAO26455.1 gamma carbonic anhydrase family protein [Methylophaga sp.]HCD04983.1 gamma carbonic anhydrase family protein [Methylophaga sp.]